MPRKLNTKALPQHWVHSHEEDTDTEMVFRPASYNFPRSRGRSSFELRPNGALVQSGPGPVDIPQESVGTWALEGKQLALYGGTSQTEPSRVLQIASLSKDRLVVKKPTG